MKTKLIATTLLVGALTTSVLAHGNNMQEMNCMNGQMMEQGMKMHNNMNQKNMMKLTGSPCSNSTMPRTSSRLYLRLRLLPYKIRWTRRSRPRQ